MQETAQRTFQMSVFLILNRETEAAVGRDTRPTIKGMELAVLYKKHYLIMKKIEK